MDPVGLAKASEMVIWLFERAGVRLIWLDGRAPQREQEVGACSKQFRSAQVMLRIIDDFTPDRHRAEILGMAVPPVYATVYRSAIRRIGSEDDVAEYIVLSAAIAHEIGHLLLGPQAHAPAGLMRARWSAGDLRAAARTALVFSKREAREMRSEVLARSNLRVLTTNPAVFDH